MVLANRAVNADVGVPVHQCHHLLCKDFNLLHKIGHGMRAVQQFL
jgi:hypothetical protein